MSCLGTAWKTLFVVAIVFEVLQDILDLMSEWDNVGATVLRFLKVPPALVKVDMLPLRLNLLLSLPAQTFPAL